MDITVLLATYNRSEVLGRTLEGFCGLDVDGIDVEFVVVDNNSTDGTKKVVDEFAGRLNLRYLFERQTGKSFALNKGLREIELGDIVVFTDDDVSPEKDWLKAIYQSGKKHTDVMAFGGRIFPHWEVAPPRWLAEIDKNFYCWAYAFHDLGDDEMFYSMDRSPNEPFGPNFWARKELLQKGRCFDERIGPTNSMSTRIMGEDTHFVQQIQKDGYKILYWPKAVVGHRIEAGQMTLGYLKERALTIGRTRAMSSPFKMPGLYKKCKPVWVLLRYIFCMIGIIKRLPMVMTLNTSKRYAGIISLYKRVGYDVCYVKNAKSVFEMWKSADKGFEPQVDTDKDIVISC